jgi:hypothetical protein
MEIGLWKNKIQPSIKCLSLERGWTSVRRRFASHATQSTGKKSMSAIVRLHLIFRIYVGPFASPGRYRSSDLGDTRITRIRQHILLYGVHLWVMRRATLYYRLNRTYSGRQEPLGQAAKLDYVPLLDCPNPPELRIVNVAFVITGMFSRRHIHSKLRAYL